MIEKIVKQLTEARDESQKQVKAIDDAINALSARKPPRGERRFLSADARHRISLAQKARWRAVRKNGGRKAA